MPAAVHILTSDQIDREKWDRCVAADPHALIYNRSWWLDAMTQDWIGVLWNDYEAVWPLAVRTKWGIRMAYTPPFTQRLDICGSYSDQAIRKMWETIKRKISLIHCHTSVSVLAADYQKTRTNFALSIAGTYPEIAAGYHTSCKKNISKAERRGCALQTGADPDGVIHQYIQTYGEKAAYSSLHYQQLASALRHAISIDCCHIMNVIHETDGTTVFSGLVLDDGRRLCYLLGAPTQKGREMRATYFFIDRVIRNFAGKREIFDFEGSDIPDVATFYQSFNPDKEYYYAYYVNNYPFPLNKLLDFRLMPDR